MAAEGTFNEAAPVQDVHMRIRVPDPSRPSRLYPPTSCVSMWQIEQECPTSGAPVQWEERVRFKHIGTQMYLTIKERPTARSIPHTTLSSTTSDDEESDLVGFEPMEGDSPHIMTLTKDITDVNTTFRFHAVIRDSNQVKLGAYCRVEHARTSMWVHAAKDHTITRVPERMESTAVEAELAGRMSKIEWDGAPLVALQPVGMRMFDDAFIVTGVPADQVSRAQYRHPSLGTHSCVVK